MKFHNFLLESFKKGRDFDYPGDKNTVLVFDKNAKYKKEGKTHGLMSHAIKHLHEFNPTFINNINNKTKQLIKNIQLFSLVRNSIKEIDINSITDDILINTYDYINDKIENKENLLDIEEKIHKYIIEPIKNEYSKILQNFKTSSIDVDKLNIKEINDLLKSKKTIRFTVHDNNGKQNIFYFNLNGYFSMKDKKMKTFFKIIGDPIEKLKGKFKTLKPNNKALYEI